VGLVRQLRRMSKRTNKKATVRPGAAKPARFRRESAALRVEDPDSKSASSSEG
jgi:hypothetical protein